MKSANPSSAVSFPGNFRVHIALAATDLQRSRKFYETLLGTPPAKERSGYVKFEPQDPSVNLTLNEVSEAVDPTRLPTHYGIQVKTTKAVEEAIARLSKAGFETEVEENTTCCYAVQDKVWAIDPDGNRWEVFVVLDADAEQRKDEDSQCCATDTAPAGRPASTSSCC